MSSRDQKFDVKNEALSASGETKSGQPHKRRPEWDVPTNLFGAYLARGENPRSVMIQSTIIGSNKEFGTSTRRQKASDDIVEQKGSAWWNGDRSCRSRCRRCSPAS